jgi:zinc transporter, ZIP family
MISAFLWGGLAAGALLVGYFLANRGFSERHVGIVMGIGTGALISAIAYELVPESALGSGWKMALAFALGAITFFLADWFIDSRGGSDRKNIGESQHGSSGAAVFIGTLLDNIPESIILGMTMTINGVINIAFLAAVFISNLPEGVAGTLNLEASGYSRKKVFWMWMGLIAISAVCAGAGFWAISILPEADGRIVQAFAAGAMLTMLSDVMIPEAHEHGGNTVGLFTVFGFLLAAMLSAIQ